MGHTKSLQENKKYHQNNRVNQAAERHDGVIWAKRRGGRRKKKKTYHYPREVNPGKN